MLKRLLCGVTGVLLLAVCAFFAWVISYIVSTDVLPAIRNGSLNVETSTMILNIVWEGNEIYILLATYTAISIGAAFGAVRLLKKAATA